jgi:DNA repair protein RecN (Recombination protein N)
MLKWLTIKNIALIGALDVEFGPGLTLLTGETGAGKSIIVDALGLLLGDRAAPDTIRSGSSQATVEALAETAEAIPLLEAHGLPAEGGEIVVRRDVLASGRGRATVNGALVPLSLLRELAPCLAVVHGQHEPQGLLDPASHLALVDHHGGLLELAREVGRLHQRVHGIALELTALRSDRQAIERRRDMLRYQLDEIGKARLAAGEEDALRRERALLANAERVTAISAEAYSLLHDDEEAVIPRLVQVFRRVEELAALDSRFSSAVEGRSSLRAQLEDLALVLRDFRGGLRADPKRLDEIELRLSAIDRLKRKYGVTVEEVLAFAERCEAELAPLGSPEVRERELEAALDESGGQYLGVARRLSAKRRETALDLEKRVKRELESLAMEKTRFQVRFNPEAAPDADADRSSWSEAGLETAELLLSANPGEELKPLHRIASGGELSRILLALKSVATLDAAGKTLVFDEIDAGIGGRVAEVVGRKLRAMAERHQVLCVTHLPQIAALADRHLAVRKRSEKGRTTVEIETLDSERRVQEVARMLGGEAVTPTAIRHAEEMIRSGAVQA